MYRLLAIDIDGTLLRNNKTISYSTKAIQNAKTKLSSSLLFKNA